MRTPALQVRTSGLRAGLLLLLALFLTACAPSSPALAPAAPAAQAPTVSSTGTAPSVGTPGTPAVATCANAFYPTDQNASWQYVSSSPGSIGTSSFTKSISAVAAGTFTEQYRGDGQTVAVKWLCTDLGLVASEFVGMVPVQDDRLRLDSLSHTGVTVPTEDRWQTGTEWTNAYAVTGSVRLDSQSLSGTGMIRVQNRILGEERVTVPAGTFDAFRVETMATIELTTSIGLPLPRVTVPAMSWFARNVGLVKSMATFESRSGVTELQTFSR